MIPIVPLQLPLLIIGLIVSLILIFLVPHISLIIIPLGSRGSHSRVNRRAGAGWKETKQYQKTALSTYEQIRELMEIFGEPKMVLIYEKEKKK